MHIPFLVVDIVFVRHGGLADTSDTTRAVFWTSLVRADRVLTVC